MMQIFTTWSELKTIFDPEKIPDIHNELFSMDTTINAADTVFLLKPDKGRTLFEFLNEEAQKESGTTARRALEFYENELREAQRVKKEDGMENYLSLLSCFEKRDFTGAVFFNVPMQVYKEDRFGSPFFVSGCRFCATFVQVEGFPAKGMEDKTLLRGRIRGEKPNHAFRCLLGKRGSAPLQSEEPAEEKLRFESLGVKTFFSGKTLLLVTADCSLFPAGLFGGTNSLWRALELHGIYVNGRYSFSLRQWINYPLQASLLRSFSIEKAVITMQRDAAGDAIVMKFGGKLRFNVLSADFDPFGFCPVSSREDGYIVYDNLIIKVSLGVSVKAEEIYREVILMESDALLRKSSFWEQCPHAPPEFISWQSGESPMKLGYRRIQAPAKQEDMGKRWYGMIVAVTICSGIFIKLLFAFDRNRFYAGSNLSGSGSSMGLTFALNELFSVRCTSTAILPYVKPDKSKASLLHLKGIRVSLFGLTFPPDACDIVLYPQGRKEPLGWYAVYGKEKREGESLWQK
ncbi:hypothetical protein ICN84_08005 [Akkermansia glycaniphila]|uniref:hypothetical protein n=1 Tax=Akkermansia glycaniphila TaxID=1679444 RepID=UPI001C018C70|nr:hypothetical protein [Akkermansia glycaniphila]MBT9450016.1 hypothetical protein [Akkermansia glycaniphila]